MVGSALVRFALIWWLTEQTGSPTTLATATLVSMLPILLLGPFAGALIDRWDRRWIMIISDVSIALFTALLAYLYWLEIAQIWHVYLILFLRSLGEIFQGPAMRASTSLMVPKEQLARVGGMNETLQGVVNIVSPPLGALLLGVLSMQGTLAIDVLTAALAIAPLFFVSIPQLQATSAPGKPKAVLCDTAEGLRYLWNWRGLFFLLIVLSMVRFFIMPAMSLLPLMVTQHFGGGVWQLGWMNSANGLGFVAGGVVLSLWGGFKRRTVTSVLGLFGVGLGSLAFGLVPSSAFGLAIVFMFLRTSMLPLVRGSIVAIFQTSVPPDMQGRLFTLLMSVISLAPPLGLAIGGLLAEAYGVRVLFVLGGVGCMLMALVWALTPSVLYLEDQMSDLTGL